MINWYPIIYYLSWFASQINPSVFFSAKIFLASSLSASVSSIHMYTHMYVSFWFALDDEASINWNTMVCPSPTASIKQLLLSHFCCCSRRRYTCRKISLYVQLCSYFKQAPSAIWLAGWSSACWWPLGVNASLKKVPHLSNHQKEDGCIVDSPTEISQLDWLFHTRQPSYLMKDTRAQGTVTSWCVHEYWLTAEVSRIHTGKCTRHFNLWHTSLLKYTHDLTTDATLRLTGSDVVGEKWNDWREDDFLFVNNCSKSKPNK